MVCANYVVQLKHCWAYGQKSPVNLVDSHNVMQRKILIADDEQYLTAIISLKLRQAGYQVIVADDGEHAYALACAELPDLIVTDFQMPLLSGVDMAVQLKENFPTARIPLIMLTARGHDMPPGILVRTNIQCLLSKPFSVRELLGTISEILQPPQALSA